MAVELTPKQLQALPVLMWLLDGPRRSGRSYLMAVAFVQVATRWGQWITIWDHHDSSRQSIMHLMGYIHDIVVELNKGRPDEEKLVLRRDGDRIQITGGYDGLKGKSGEEEPGSRLNIINDKYPNKFLDW